MRITQQGSRRFLAFILSVVFVAGFVLSGCGNTPSSNSDAGGTKLPSDKAVTPQAGEVKTISTINGDIEVPVHPQRIVAEEYLGSLIALEVIPVGAPELTIKNYYFKEALASVEDSGVYGKPSAERIMSLNPDLIITGNKDSYELLSKIAPTLVIPYGQLKNVHEELTYFGALFGKEKEAEAWLAEYDRRIKEAKAKVDAVIPADASFSIMEDAGKRILVYGDNFGRGGQPTYQALGRKPPGGIADEIMKKQWAEISAEVLDKYAGDYIIMTSNERTVADFKADTIWSSLPAVKNGRIYVWPEERSWYYDPLAVLAQTEELAEWLTKSAK
ncbi:ABC transporter substrate-binding protein [Paenibacillus taiwanensis]|uniref:ABC transporter substrate-binding protein n=1 Tax=Paenibacillus taiwanensis TaxID=401638 RepID=UPI00040C4E00|nr:ABC transporter substrate-binding protein [Paenibacillus taiwanensis]